GSPLTTKVLRSASTSRRHSSSTASAEVSNTASALASTTTSGPLRTWSPCTSMRRQPLAWRWVSSEGSTSMRGVSLSALGGIGLVARHQRLNEAIHPARIDLGGELSAVGFHQPHAQHVEVVDLPAGADTRGF